MSTVRIIKSVDYVDVEYRGPVVFFNEPKLRSTSDFRMRDMDLSEPVSESVTRHHLPVMVFYGPQPGQVTRFAAMDGVDESLHCLLTNLADANNDQHMEIQRLRKTIDAQARQLLKEKP